jgi:hypothetical protein
LAALVSTQGTVLIRGTPFIPETGLQQYWSASKTRLDRWGRALKASTGLANQNAPPGVQWGVFWDVLVEILASEVLTRAWTAVLCAHDRLHNQEEAEPIARSVYLGHLEARRRVLSFLAHVERLDPIEVLSLDHLRSRCERWSDWLIGHIAISHDVSEFAADPDRAAVFGRELRAARTRGQDTAAWQLLLASMKVGFRDVSTEATPNYDLNLAIGASIVGCFTPELFTGSGTLRSAALDPFLHPADDAQCLIESLFQEDQAVAKVAGKRKLGESQRWWRYGE